MDEVVVESLHRISYLPKPLSKCFYFRFSRWFQEKSSWQKKILDKLLYLSKTNSFYERWTWSSRSTMLPLEQSQRPVTLFLFLSSSLPAFHHLFSSVALRLVPMRLLFPLVFTVSLSHGTCTTARSLLLGPRCCQIVCESYGQKVFVMLRFLWVLPSLFTFLQFFAHASLMDSMFLM